MSKKSIGLFVGSLRKESWSKKLANAITALAPDGFDFTIIPIGDLPLYNQDYDDDNQVPAAYTAFRNALDEVQGVIFITPEYNRSVPAVLKNALDVGSRPVGKNKWNAKPGLVISCSAGGLAGFGAHHHLRQSLVPLNVLVLPKPEVYLSNVKEAFDDSGKLSEKVQGLLKKAIDAYIEWFNKLN